MKTTRHPLGLLFPESRAALLRLLFRVPMRSFHVRELARRTEMPLSAVHQELHNLRTLGVLTSSSKGYHRFYSADRSHALFQPLAGLVAASDKLSTIDHVPYRRAKRRKKRRMRKHPSPDLPVRWGIFKARTRT